LPAYEIVRELGRGGMGVVYLARHRQLKRLTALKFLPEHLAGQAFHLARFRQEAEAVARLKHPGIVQIYDVGEHAGRTFLALEYVDGGSLYEHFHRQPLPADEAARLIEAIARAVQAAHEVGIVHRDLKSSNILLDETGPKVADFGLSRLVDTGGDRTPAGLMMGTPQYMSPEQARGDTQAISPATDVYGLGAILYELLAGKPPLVAASTVETLKLVCERKPIPPSHLRTGVPAELEAICLRCLEKNPAERFPSAQALADELKQMLATWQQPAVPVANAPLRPSALSRRWMAAAVGLGLLAIAAVPIAIVSWPKSP
jgi:serine/threonine protein kinase